MIDGPDSRAEVEKVLYRLQEAVKEINTATNDQETRARIQRSWHLQDLLVVPDFVRPDLVLFCTSYDSKSC